MFYIHCSCVSIQVNVTGYPVYFIVNSVYWTHTCNVSMHLSLVIETYTSYIFMCHLSSLNIFI